MLMSRAYEILEKLRLREGAEMTPEEQSELLSNRLIGGCTTADYEEMRKAVRDVSPLTVKVRDLSAQLESGLGPLSTGQRRLSKSEKDTVRETLQHALAELEDAVGKKAAIEMLIYNPVTRSYASLSLTGRKMLVDMAAWKSRYGSEELTRFMERMISMRRAMEISVGGALKIVDDFVSPRPGMIKPELRAPALIASQSGMGAQEFERLYAGTPETDGIEGYQEEGELFLTTYLSSSRGGNEYLMSKFDESYRGLVGTDLGDGNLILKAVALADSSSGDQKLIIDRMKWLKQNMVLPDENDIVWLAKSEFPPEEVKSRYDTLISAVVASGHQENSDLRTACAIMAGSPHTVDVLERRFVSLAGQLKYVFDANYIAAAMMASGPLEPDEAMHVFKEAVGVISRANYFDDADEVENLALLVTNRFGPDAQAIEEPSPVVFAPQATPTDTAEEQTEQQPAPTYRYRRTPYYHYYYWHNRYYGRPTYSYFRSHPGHMHTVPHFG